MIDWLRRLSHRPALELAAVSIDWPLSDAERAELDAHLAVCAGCRGDAAAMRADGDALRILVRSDPRTREYGQPTRL